MSLNASNENLFNSLDSSSSSSNISSNVFSNNNTNSNTNTVSIKRYLTNSIGAIDGCKTLCNKDEINIPYSWKQNIAGFIDIEMNSNFNHILYNTQIIVRINNTKIKKFEIIFVVKGEITLDNIVDFLPTEIVNKALRNKNNTDFR